MQELHRRQELAYNPNTRQQEPVVVIMVKNRAGRYLTIWAGKDESMFPGSAAGKAWAAGEPLPLPSSTSPKGAGRRKAVSRGSLVPRRRPWGLWLPG